MPMHIQDRNIHYKIFGGYILREAFEIGFLAAYDIGGGYMPHIQFVDDVQFISPVEIGAVMKFKATVTCVLKGYAYIIVECIRIIFDHDNNKKIHQKTNDLKLIFHVGDKAKDVIPVAYQEVLQFIKGKDQLIKRIFAPMELQNQQAKINQ
ncbi:hypothetical protein PPERSA_02089 [Pseudocohnilembus persalinus]|uniref:HotDog ACOT-type domain-containing protein n=1 Tax=Pseudocohnilembus persalinus TaxID=266149 RepID=A0A0V0Q7U1_PSEPJ|nr:hypothetical protein PPERSA_02089 [Pseudocohnilembus persalinus]|eukprot:KRW98312.1 hypothetical protein PPERSA_02089 [Pseudocohnilembus persalinus]